MAQSDPENTITPAIRVMVRPRLNACCLGNLVVADFAHAVRRGDVCFCVNKGNAASHVVGLVVGKRCVGSHIPAFGLGKDSEVKAGIGRDVVVLDECFNLGHDVPLLGELALLDVMTVTHQYSFRNTIRYIFRN
jgi:hypothetical protein